MSTVAAIRIMYNLYSFCETGCSQYTLRPPSVPPYKATVYTQVLESVKGRYTGPPTPPILATVYTQVGVLFDTLHHPPQSPLGKGGRIWTDSLPFTREELGWGNAGCSNLDSSVLVERRRKEFEA